MRNEIKLEVMTETPIFPKKTNAVLWVLIAIVFATSAVLTVRALNDWEYIQSHERA